MPKPVKPSVAQDGVSVRQVAQRAGVSIATVSRSLNNPDAVASTTRERVLQLADEMGYKPSPLGRSLVTGRSYLIGLVIPNIGTPLYGEMAKGVEDAFVGTGLQVVLASSRDDPELEARLVEGLIERSVDAGIVINARAESSYAQIHRGWVHISPESPDFPVRIELDNYAGAKLAVNYLVGLGRRRVAHIAGPLREGGDRERGWRDELGVNRLPLGPRIVGDYTLESGARAAEEALLGKPDAIFAAGDLMAVGALQTLRRAEVRVPQDVALVGFDDAEIAALVHPALTTVRQPSYLMGRRAAELVLTYLAGEEPATAIFQPDLIERSSTRLR